MQIDVKKPEKIEFTLTATFTLESWKKIRERLKGDNFCHPASELTDGIRSMVDQAENTFWPKGDD